MALAMRFVAAFPAEGAKSNAREESAVAEIERLLPGPIFLLTSPMSRLKGRHHSRLHMVSLLPAYRYFE
jgi:hypothetical protein